MQRIFLAETEAKAQELGKAYLRGGGIGAFARPEWMVPPGDNSKEARRRMARQFADPKTGEQVIFSSSTLVYP